MKHYIGIDGGGTNSRLLGVDVDLNPICTVYGGSTNVASSSEEAVSLVLKNLLDDFYKQSKCLFGDCLGVCIGAAGVDNDSQARVVYNILKSFGFECECKVVNDSLLPLYAHGVSNQGVVLISGTGSIACGVDSEGNSCRVGGWGHLLDDGGSGYWVGIKALRHAFMAYDGRAGDTVLVEMFKNHFCIEDLSHCVDVVYGEYAKDKAKIAQFSKFVSKGAAAGDEVCLQILQGAVYELYSLVSTMFAKLGTDKLTIVACGGNILGNLTLFEMFKQHVANLNPNARVLKSEKDAVWGAIKMLV